MTRRWRSLRLRAASEDADTRRRPPIRADTAASPGLAGARSPAPRLEALPSRHAYRGPRTAGGPQRRRRAGGGAGRQGTPAPRRPRGRRARRRQHRPPRRGALERRPAGDRAQVPAGPPRPPAQRPRARPATRLDRPVRRPPRAPVTRSADREDIDALRIADLAARGRARLAAGDAAEAVRALTAALDLWRGEPYGDWPDAPFADAERRRLAEVRTGAARRRCSRPGSRSGRTPRSLAEPERLLAEDPLQEEWWRLLVLALYRCGRQGDALAAVAAGSGRARRAAGRRTRARRCARWRPRSSPRTRRWISPSRRPRHAPAGAAGAGVVPVQGPGRLPGGRRAAVPRPRAAGLPPGGAAGRRAAARRVRGRAGPASPRWSAPGWSRRWRGGALPGSESWRPVIVTPGRAPGRRPRRPDRRPAAGRSRAAGLRPVRGALGAGLDPAERTAFLDAVSGLLDDGIVVRCVVVVRGDHVGRLAEHPAFTERLGAGVRPRPAAHRSRSCARSSASPPGRRTAGGRRTRRRRRGRRPRAGRRPAAAVDRAGRHLGTAPRRPADPRRLPGGGRRRRRADPVGRGRLRARSTRTARSSPAGCSCGWPTPTTAARWSGAPLPLAELDLDGERGAARRDGGRGLRRPPAARRRRRPARGRARGPADRLAAAGPVAGGRRRRPGGAPAPRPRPPGSGSAGGRPDDELYRGARLAAALDWADDAGRRRHAGRAAVPRRLAGARPTPS